MFVDYKIFDGKLTDLPESKLLINTINAHSYNVSINDKKFKLALLSSNVLLPDGVSVKWAEKQLRNNTITKIAGEDLFNYEMNRMNAISGKCFFLGSNEETLSNIKFRSGIEFPNVSIETYSPPFKPKFSVQDNEKMLDSINNFNPDVLFIGLTAPKQEKWAHQHFDKISAKHICSIGAVFGFYARTVRRAPKWVINIHLEWLYRFLQEPTRLWRRYLIGNMKFIYHIYLEKYFPEKFKERFG